jgi:GMP synthase-like glutamine amidotransferase
VFQWHEDTFEIPKWGSRLATSAAVPNQAFRYGDNAYGLQFHLEVTTEMIRDWIYAYSQEPSLQEMEMLTATEWRFSDFTARGTFFLNRFFRG